MSGNGAVTRRDWPLPVRVVLSRPRLLVSFVVGVCTFALLASFAGELHVLTRSLLAWDVGLAIYLVIAFWIFARSGPTEIRRRAAMEDVGSVTILLLTVGACAGSVGAVFAWLELSNPAEIRGVDGLFFLYATVILSWTLIHTIFALHYAHEFYGDGQGEGDGLAFPGNREPDYFDFVYFAFTIGTSTAVSDVAISEKRIRHTVTLHSIVAFFFNVTILALTVGLIGDAIQN